MRVDQTQRERIVTIPEGPIAQTPSPIDFRADAVAEPATGVVMPFPRRMAGHTAYQTVAWRAPTATRFDGRPANDVLARAEAVVPFRTWKAPSQGQSNEPAGWFTFAVGACIAALLGALLGGLMSV